MFEIVSKSQNRTRMTRIARIFTDTSYPRVSAQSAFHHICCSLKNPASETKVSAFIRVYLRFFIDVVFQTGSTGSVFNPVHPVILSNNKGGRNFADKILPDADALIIRLREGTPVDSVDLAEGIIAHYSKDKKILEIEILDASKVVQMNELNVSLKSAQVAVA